MLVTLLLFYRPLLVVWSRKRRERETREGHSSETGPPFSESASSYDRPPLHIHKNRAPASLPRTLLQRSIFSLLPCSFQLRAEEREHASSSSNQAPPLSPLIGVHCNALSQPELVLARDVSPAVSSLTLPLSPLAEGRRGIGGSPRPRWHLHAPSPLSRASP